MSVNGVNNMITKSSACIVLNCLILFTDALDTKSSYSVDDSNDLRHRRQTTSVECTLPPHPDHGSWKLLSGQGNPGDKVATSTIILFECKPGYKLSSKIPSFCLGGWSSPVPECEELCPPLYPSNSYDLACVDKLGKDINCTEATHGTNLEYTCKTFYETPFGYKTTLLCENGKWDNQKPVCQPVCGRKVANDKTPLIYGAKPNENIEHPWVAAVYRKINETNNFVCGASILSPTVVITAAHCVTNDFGDLLPKEEYTVGVGKLYREYKAAKDTKAQYLQLLKIIVPEDYRADIRKFAADIAVLVVKEEIILNEVTQPVCFTNMKNIHLHAGNKGEVSGWGLIEGGILSDVLRSIVIPYKYETVCADELPSEWADRYNLRDKICAGFVNQSINVCHGDSGGGLAFKYRDDNRYYIHGIVSVGHQVESMCNIQQNALYTSVASYYDFVDRALAKYAPKDKDCVLPPYPQDGKWTTDEAKWNPGDSVPSSTVLKVECDDGFKLSSRRNVECSEAYTLPTCDILCPELEFRKGTDFTCLSKEGEYIRCSAATDGSTVQYSCPTGYNAANKAGNGTCVKGSWGLPKPECIRECGRKVVDKSGSGSDYPWNVGIYRVNNDDEEEYKFICSGSLVSETVIVTAAQCVTDESGNLLPVSNYLIGAGKLYRDYDDPRDIHVEYSNITYINVHPGYKATHKRIFDIALLVSSSGFVLDSFIQPICVMSDEDYWFNEDEDTGLMPGWRGLLEEDDVSEELAVLDVRVLFNDTLDLIQVGDYDFDKAVIEFKNESDCLHPEDLGKGIIFKNPDNDRYYLDAVVNYDYGITGCQRKFQATEINIYHNIIECTSSQTESVLLYTLSNELNEQ